MDPESRSEVKNRIKRNESWPKVTHFKIVIFLLTPKFLQFELFHIPPFQIKDKLCNYPDIKIKTNL